MALTPDELLAFLEDSPLVIHNAAFDLKFLNAELIRIDREPINPARVIDTLALAQRRFPGAPASLDALCRRFGVDASARTLHGALLDCQLLAEVYLHLLGGRQTDLGLQPANVTPIGGALTPARVVRRVPRAHAASPEEEAAHAALLEKLVDPIWRR
jgi:DNA polymerase-3 subunit epsilon